jgi:NitT/TauT family transport system substrate-binding protein
VGRLQETRAGLYRTQKWLHASPPAALAEAVRPFFAAVPAELLGAAIARYRALGIWGSNPILPRAGYDRLAAGLVSGGFVRQAVPYELAVDSSLAAEIIDEEPPPL